MADPTALSYYDPFDETQFTDSILIFHENPQIDLSELPLTEPKNSFDNRLIPGSDGDDMVEGDDPRGNRFVWGMLNPTGNNSQADPSESHAEISNNGHEIPQQPQSSDFGSPLQLSVWPVPPVPFTCSCCQVLREITHTNGIHITRLEIHGRIGLICHAVLENRLGGDWTTRNQYQMFDFCKKSIETVKEFLIGYCQDRKQAGYRMLQDPLLTFYEALCVGSAGDVDLDVDDFFQGSPAFSGEYQMNGPRVENQQLRLPKGTLAAQRKRTGKLTLKDFIAYFHLPIDAAARKLNICPTVIKKICRRHGLVRWPYRKIKSIERKISSKRASLAAIVGAEERERAEADIQRFQQELTNMAIAFTT